MLIGLVLVTATVGFVCPAWHWPPLVGWLVVCCRCMHGQRTGLQVSVALNVLLKPADLTLRPRAVDNEFLLHFLFPCPPRVLLKSTSKLAIRGQPFPTFQFINHNATHNHDCLLSFTFYDESINSQALYL